MDYDLRRAPSRTSLLVVAIPFALLALLAAWGAVRMAQLDAAGWVGPVALALLSLGLLAISLKIALATPRASTPAQSRRLGLALEILGWLGILTSALVPTDIVHRLGLLGPSITLALSGYLERKRP